MVNRKSFILCLICGIGFLFCSACLKEPYFPGKDPGKLYLRITLAEEKTLSTRAVASAIKELSVKVTCKEALQEQTVDYTGNGEQLFEFDSLYPGKWKIEVSGLDELGDCIFYGDHTKDIRPGETASVSIEIRPAPGRLKVEMEISNLRAMDVNVTEGKFYYYPDPKSGTSKSFSLELDGDWLRGEGELPEGTFQGDLYIPQKTAAKYQSSYYTITIRAGKLTQLNIDADVALIIESHIDSSPATPEGFNVKRIEAGKFGLSWERVTDSDLAGYYIYRTDKNGRFIFLAEVEPGIHTYQDVIEANNFFDGRLGYAVSSYDFVGNVSIWSELRYISIDQL